MLNHQRLVLGAWGRTPTSPVARKRSRCDVVHASTQPFLMDFKRVVAEVHAVGNNQVHHRVEMTVKHATVDAQNAKTFLEKGRCGEVVQSPGNPGRSSVAREAAASVPARELPPAR